MACNTIGIEDVRNYVQDRTIEDNELELDLTFSNDEIRDAMKRAIRAYNSVPPLLTINVSTENLPGDTNMFLDGTVYHLYISRVSRLQRNDIDYTAGGVVTNLEKKQIEYLTQMIQFHKQQFMEAVVPYKKMLNLRSAYGSVG